MTSTIPQAEVRAAWLSYSLQLKRSFGVVSDTVWVKAPSDDELKNVSQFELERLADYLKRQTAALKAF